MSIMWVVLLLSGIVYIVYTSFAATFPYIYTSYTALVKENEHSSLEQFPAGQTNWVTIWRSVLIGWFENKMKWNELLYTEHHQKVIVYFGYTNISISFKPP